MNYSKPTIPHSRLDDPPPPPSPFSITRIATNQRSPGLNNSLPLFTRQPSNGLVQCNRKDPPLLHNPRPTHPMVWCSAIICLVFCLLLIFFGVATLIIFLVIRPRLIATQALEPIRQRPGEGKLQVVHLISSLVYLPPNPAIELQRQVQRNRVKYNIRGTFRVRARVGGARFTYWLHARCQLEMTSPPSGILVARNCKIKR